MKTRRASRAETLISIVFSSIRGSKGVPETPKEPARFARRNIDVYYGFKHPGPEKGYQNTPKSGALRAPNRGLPKGFKHLRAAQPGPAQPSLAQLSPAQPER